MAGADAIVRVDFVANTRDLARGAQQAQGATRGLGASLKSLGKAGAAAGVAAVATEMVRAVKAGSDLNESINAVKVTFGPAASEVLKFSEGAAELGLSMADANELLVPVGAALQNYGFSAGEAASASVDLATRAADMASVFNTSVPEAMQAIQAGLRGEADPLERFGVNLSAAAVDAQAMSMGLAKNTKELTAQDKAHARVALVMKQTNKFAGDFKNTSSGLANTQRIVAAELANVEARIGQGLLPVIAAAIALVREHWPEITAALQTAWTVIQPLLAAMGALFVQVASLIQAHWPEIRPLVLGVAAVVGAAIRVIVSVIRLLTAILRGDWSAAWTEAKAVVQNVVKLISAMLRLEVTVWRTILSAAWTAIRAGVSAAWSAIKTVISSAVSWIGSEIAKIPGKVASIVHDTGVKAGEVGAAIVSGVKSGVSAAVSWIGTTIAGIPRKITDELGRIETAADKIGSAIASGIKNGVSAAITWIGQQLAAIPGKITSILNKIPGAGALKGLVKGSSAPPAGVTAAFPVPHLAAGGVLTRPTLFLGGEAGREIVTPERLLRSILRDERAGATYVLNLTTQRADAAEIAYGFRRLELLEVGR